MPAHSFGPEWLNPLLRSDKQGTTRPQHTRVKVGDIVSIYNQQRRRIIDKPIMHLTNEGCAMMEQRIADKNYPLLPFYNPISKYVLQYYAHFLGKVRIIDVYDIIPIEMTGEELEAWALSDGFGSFDPPAIIPDLVHQSANWWFSDRYGNDWMHRTWTVERWHGWAERFFEPEAI